jgi:nicotinate-nucleotide adenylyltransferase
LGILAGAFNPVTRAHLALADAALSLVDEVVCVVPRIYPHKDFDGAGLDHRIEMLSRAGGRYQVEVSERGLFIDIARELRRSQPDADLYFICGRDAAERVVSWDYGVAGAIERMLAEFQLLVASRQGDFAGPAHLRHRVHPLRLVEPYDDVSSSEVRRRISAGEPWEHLVPERIVEMVRHIYTSVEKEIDSEPFPPLRTGRTPFNKT